MDNINNQVRSLSPLPSKPSVDPPVQNTFDQQHRRPKSALTDSKNDETKDSKMRRTKHSRRANKEFGEKRAGTVSQIPQRKFS